jgi:uncharacterized protein YegL
VRYNLPRRKKTSRLTLINYIIDESGSMFGIADQVRNGFNEYVEELGKEEGVILLTLTKFNTSTDTPVSLTPLADVPRLTTENYMPSGSTALYDAIADTIAAVEKSVDANTKVITVIMTDGQENASVENTEKQVNTLIKAKTGEGNWTFVFLGADQDAWAQAQGLGIARGNTISYASHTHANTMRGVSKATAHAHSNIAVAATGTLFEDAGQSQADYDNAGEAFDKDNDTSS